MKEIVFSRQADKALRSMTTNQAARIKAKIGQYARDPGSLANNAKRLQGTDLMRLRIGDWRVVFDEDGHVLAILVITSRGSAYGG